MGRLAVLLQDLPADKRSLGFSVRHKILTTEQWTDVLAADARGVSARAMYGKLKLEVQPFFASEKQFSNAIMAERAFRRNLKAASVKKLRSA